MDLEQRELSEPRFRDASCRPGIQRIQTDDIWKIFSVQKETGIRRYYDDDKPK